jgi:uncharacterized protein YwqG
MPSQERIVANWGSFDLESGQALEDALDDMQAPSPVHQMAGYPAPIQGDDMELDCQKIVHSQWTVADAANWRLLLQLDSDDDAGMMWGDIGRLYFWIHEKDALAGDFSKIWVILQSH